MRPEKRKEHTVGGRPVYFLLSSISMRWSNFVMVIKDAEGCATWLTEPAI
jgi:hypothetical protein